MFSLRSQATLNSEVKFSGVGVHSGQHVNMRILPACEGFGIQFRRTDVSSKNNIIKLSAESVVDPTLCTRLVNKSGVSVAVVEHLLAALRIFGITNALIEIDSLEVPIMDGSSKEFIDAFKSVGLKYQSGEVPAIFIKRPLELRSKTGYISISPADACEISVKIEYDRINPVIGSNNEYVFGLDQNLNDLVSSRTFGWIEDYEKVRAMGLARGTSEENTVVIMPDHSIKNAGGLRNSHELVMHKCLDLVGDISVLIFDIIGKIEGYNTSHLLNNQMMRKLLNELKYHDVVYSSVPEYKAAVSF